MQARLFLFGACLTAAASALAQEPALEYSGVYISTPEEDYFTPCGIERVGDTWSLRFRDDDIKAPFLKKVTAIRGYPPLTHFIRIRGKLSGPGSYNLGFQTRELAVDTVLEVKETLEPCAGFGAPAAWDRLPGAFRNSRGIAMSADRRRVAVIDIDGAISIWSTDTGQRIRKLGSIRKGDVTMASYGPITFSDDGKLLAVGGRDRVVRVWRISDGKRIFSLALKDSAAVAKEMAKIPPRSDGYRQPLPPNAYTPARTLAFNKRGTMLVTSNLFSAILWSMKNGKKLAEFPIGSDFRRKIFFIGNEGLLMTADSGRMTIRSYLDAKPVAVPGARPLETDLVALSPDGRTILSGTWGNSLFLWQIGGGPRRVLHVPGFVTGVTAFSPSGDMLAIAGGSSGLYLYDLRTGAAIKSFHNLPNALSGAWFSADGKSIITMSHFDDRFRILYVDPSARPANQPIFDDSLTAQLPLGPPPSNAPRTISGIVSGPGPNPRAVPGAEVMISNGDAPNSVIARATTSPGGYFSFNGIRFRHVVIRVRKQGFAPGVKYIHVYGWENEGPWGIELTPEERPAESPGGA